MVSVLCVEIREDFIDEMIFVGVEFRRMWEVSYG